VTHGHAPVASGVNRIRVTGTRQPLDGPLVHRTSVIALKGEWVSLPEDGFPSSCSVRRARDRV